MSKIYEFEKEYFKPSEVAKILGLKVDTIRLWVRQRKIHAVRIHDRIYIPRSELERLLFIRE